MRNQTEGYFVCKPFGDVEEGEMPRVVDGSEVASIARAELPDLIVRAIDGGAAIDDVLADLDPALHRLARRYHSLRIHPPQGLAGQHVCIG